MLKVVKKKKSLKRSSMLVGKWALSFSLNKRSIGSLSVGFLRTCCKMGGQKMKNFQKLTV